MNTEKKTIEMLEKVGFDYEIANSYGEPGYDSERPILLGNWSELTPEQVDGVEDHFEVEWSDEWTVLYDEDCKAFRTSPDCYHWQPSIVLWNCEWVSIDHLKDSGELANYIRDELAGKDNIALNGDRISGSDLDPIASKVDGDFEAGFHPGQTSNPAEILKSTESEKRANCFFRIDSTSQFTTCFELWMLKEPE